MNDAEFAIWAKRFPAEELKDKHGQSKGVWLSPICRVAFEELADVEAGKKYSAAFIFHPESDLSALFDAARRAAVTKYGDVSRVPKSFRSPFKEQSEMAEKYEGFSSAGLFINAASKYPPKFYALDGKTLIALSKDTIYSGCYVRVAVNPYTYDKDGEGKPVTPGCSFGIQFLQFVADGDKLSGGIDGSEYLTAIEGLPTAASTNAPAQQAAAPAASKSALF